MVHRDDSAKFVLVSLGVFSGLFAAGYLSGMSDQDALDLSELSSRIGVVHAGEGVVFEYSCWDQTSAQPPQAISYDPDTRTITVPVDVQASAFGPPGQQLHFDMEVAKTLLGGASAGITVQKLSKLAEFNYKGKRLWQRAKYVTRKTGRWAMFIVGAISGYELGYYIGNKTDLRCQSPELLARLKSKEFWADQTKRYAIVNLAWLKHSMQQCESSRLSKLIARAETEAFSPTPDEIAFIEGVTTEESCTSGRMGMSGSGGFMGPLILRTGLKVPFSTCRGVYFDYNACALLSPSVPPDVAAWQATVQECSTQLHVIANESSEDCATSFRETAKVMCSVSNPKYQALKKRYSANPAVLAAIAPLDSSDDAVRTVCEAQ